MCRSIAEGGRRCNGGCVTAEQFLARQQKIRAYDRERKARVRKAAKQSTTQEASVSEPQFMSVHDAAARLGIGVHGVRVLTRNGKLPITDNRIPVEAVEARAAMTPAEIAAEEDRDRQARERSRTADMSPEELERYRGWQQAIGDAQTEADADAVYRDEMIAAFAEAHPSLDYSTVVYLADRERRESEHTDAALTDARREKIIQYITNVRKLFRDGHLPMESRAAVNAVRLVTRSTKYEQNIEMARETPIFVNGGDGMMPTWCVLAQEAAIQGDSVEVRRADGSSSTQNLRRRPIVPLGKSLVLVV
jgi:hypothetical protein